MIARVRAVGAATCCCSRAATSCACWPRAGSGSPPAGGRYFLLGTASLSALGYEHDATEPVIRFWNDTRHVTPACQVSRQHVK